MATAQRNHETDPGEMAEQTVPLVIQTLMTATKTSPAEIAAVLGIAKSGVSEKLHGHRRLTIKDVGRLAHFFGVDPGVFFVDPAEALARASRSPSTTWSAPEDEAAGQRPLYALGQSRLPGIV